MPDLPGADLVDRVQRDLDRSRLRAINGIKLLGGIGRPKVGQTPKDVVLRAGRAELWRYRGDPVVGRPPVLLVHSLVSRSYLFDLSPGNSFVEHLIGQGFDVFLVDWGEPNELDAGNTLETYSDVLMPAMVEAALAASGAETVQLFSYCLGGVIALLYLAGHSQDASVSALVTLATPVDFDHAIAPFPQMVREGRIDPEKILDGSGNVPADVMFNLFRLMAPTQEISGYAQLWHKLWDDDYVNDFQIMAGWSKDQVPFAGTCMKQCADLLAVKNLLASGRVPFGGRIVELADITVPFLNVVGAYDHVVSPAANGGLTSLVGSTDVTEHIQRTGHVGLVIGRYAQSRYIPAMTEWLLSKGGRT